MVFQGCFPKDGPVGVLSLAGSLLSFGGGVVMLDISIMNRIAKTGVIPCVAAGNRPNGFSRPAGSTG